MAKALTYEKRKDPGKDKDCGYLYLLALMTHNMWPSIQTDLADLDILTKWRERGYQQLRTLFASADSDGPTRAARSLANPEHTPKRIAAVMRRFLTALNISQ